MKILRYTFVHEMALLCTSWPQERGSSHRKPDELVELDTIYIVCVCMCVQSLFPMLRPLASVHPWLYI